MFGLILAAALTVVPSGTNVIRVLPPPPKVERYDDGVEKPPAKYDHPPTITWVALHLERDELIKFCGSDAVACTKPYIFDVKGPFCLTLLQWKYDDGFDPVHVWHHERAHCNGWRHAE